MLFWTALFRKKREGTANGEPPFEVVHIVLTGA
jgi:hypothetical protein